MRYLISNLSILKFYNVAFIYSIVLFDSQSDLKVNFLQMQISDLHNRKRNRFLKILFFIFLAKNDRPA